MPILQDAIDHAGINRRAFYQYTAEVVTNDRGVSVLRLQFRTGAELERFFIHELLGSEAMKGSASKVIGTTLLIWDR